MDKTSLNYANLFGYQEALGLKGNQFNYLSASMSMICSLLYSERHCPPFLVYSIPLSAFHTTILMTYCVLQWYTPVISLGSTLAAG